MLGNGVFGTEWDGCINGWLVGNGMHSSLFFFFSLEGEEEMVTFNVNIKLREVVLLVVGTVQYNKTWLCLARGF